MGDSAVDVESGQGREQEVVDSGTLKIPNRVEHVVDDVSRQEQRATETSPLLREEESLSPRGLSDSGLASGDYSSLDQNRHKKAASVISFLLIGVFIASADSSLILAINGTISSSFHRLQDASWLTTGYILAMCATQPVIAKLSDIFGRKPVVIFCYVIFGIGTTICGVGQEMWQVIAGRVISGVGGSGMIALISILITDLLPKIEVAAWRSYVNVVTTIGRSVGAPLGGWLADSVGWRWSFIGQVPFVALALLLVIWGLENQQTTSHEPDSIKMATSSKLRRVDFVGAILLSTGIIGFLLAVDLPSRGMPWSSSTVISLIVCSLVLGAIFFFFESKHAAEPIFPPRLLVLRDVATTYSTACLQIAATMAMQFSVPLYFQVTQEASNTSAGAHLVPVVLGNTIGGLTTGYLIRRTGRYKILFVSSAVSAASSYLVMLIRWQGHTNFIESLEVIPAGLGTGIAVSSTFIALTAKLTHDDMAVATAGLFLSANVGQVLGVSISSSLQRWRLNSLLTTRVHRPDSNEIIEHVLSDVSYIRDLDDILRNTVVSSYVKSLKYSHGFSLLCSTIAFLISLLVHEQSLIEEA